MIKIPQTFDEDGYTVKKKRYAQTKHGTPEEALALQKRITDEKRAGTPRMQETSRTYTEIDTETYEEKEVKITFLRKMIQKLKRKK